MSLLEKVLLEVLKKKVKELMELHFLSYEEAKSIALKEVGEMLK